MSVKQKFDEDDRRAVVDWLKKHDSVSILKKPEYRKLFEDTNGRLYLVLGAYDEWHGVPEAILNMETEKLENGVLVIARRYPQSCPRRDTQKNTTQKSRRTYWHY